MNISKCLTISTSHISWNTSNKLRTDPMAFAIGLSVYEKGEYGWWIYIGDNINALPSDLPNDLMECIRLAMSNDCEWLCLDCDGEEIHSLQTFEW